jgi:hypothetical protein
MAILCRDYDLLFTLVPRTGGAFVRHVLTSRLGGEVLSAQHLTIRQTMLDDPPSTRVFTMREPVEWYRSYWAHSRASVAHPAAWPIWPGDEPTRSLDRLGGHRTFAGFVRKALREFPNGFVRSLYCDYLNGATHVLRSEQLHADLESLLELVGYDNPAVVHELSDGSTAENAWKGQALLAPDLEAQLRDVENLEGLEFPYVTPPLGSRRSAVNG